MSIRILGLLKRRPDITREQFVEHWSKNHMEIFLKLKAVREGVVRYGQIHILEDESDRLAALGLPIAPYDGVAEFWVEKLEDMLALWADKDYLEKGIPDEGLFLDREAVQVVVGDYHLKHDRA